MTPTLVAVKEYLSTSYRPDCDYVDGELRDRNVGEFEHSSTQAEIVVFLRGKYPALTRRVLTEQRVQISSHRFRIPDVCVTAAQASAERIVKTPPELCIEILSRDDRMSEMLDRVRDYLNMGVPACWIIDPLRRVGMVATIGHIDEAADGVLRAAGLAMPLVAVLPETGSEPTSD